MFIRKNIEMFQSGIHNINTRQKGKLVIPYFRLAKVKKSFLGNSIRFYNKIPPLITKMTDIQFKAHIKKVLKAKAYYKIIHYIEDKAVWK